MNPYDPYLAYYRHQQLGHGVSSVYRGATFQRGHGIGSILGGLIRTFSPLIKSGTSAVGKEALRTGVGFLGDIASGTVRPRHAAGVRFKEFTNTLKRKADEKMERVLSGGGAYKKRRISRVSPQSLNRLLSAHIKGRSSKKRSKVRKQGRVVKRRRRKVTRRTKKGKVVKRRRTRRAVKHRDIFN